jgi:hypothetical protein
MRFCEAGCRCAPFCTTKHRLSAYLFTAWLFPTGVKSACKETVYRKERETGLEPATACLEGRNSTTELLPLIDFLSWSGCADSNCGPPAPKAGALPTAPHPAVPTFSRGKCLHYSTPLVICQALFHPRTGAKDQLSGYFGPSCDGSAA